MKRNGLLALLLFWMNLIPAVAQEKGNQYLRQLFTLSVENLNYSGLTSEDQIISLCQKAERVARQSKDYENLFHIEQIAINSYCLKGDVGLALNRAQQMLDEAKKQKSDIGIALAFQAIGNTYMHSNQNEQAYIVFEDVAKRLEYTIDDHSKLKLLIQQMQVCVNLGKMEELQSYLITASKLLDYNNQLVPQRVFAFYLLYYQTLHNIGIKDAELARLSLLQISQPQFSGRAFAYGRNYLSTRYYELIGDYAQSLSYCDSTLATVSVGENLSEYKNLLITKAMLLEKNGLKEEACLLYDSSLALSDSLNSGRYSRQIDSLHIAYWVDEMALEITAANNKLLTRVLFYSVLLLLTVGILIFFVKKQNRRLLLSRSSLNNMRQEASDSYQTKSLFLSNMSHELRTPLNAIVGFSQLLGGEEPIDDETKEQCSALVQQNANLLLKLFSDVADFSALCDNKMRFTYQSCDVVALCSNVLDTVDKVKRTEAQVQFVTTIDQLELNTDSGRLQQVLINLLINATKFTSQGTITLRLEVDAAQDEALFSVEDTGCGIPLEKQPHIFERFEKLHEGVQGAGLGLSICQFIINNVGGRIWIDPSYTQGARFVFTHPLHFQPEAEEGANSATPLSTE